MPSLLVRLSTTWLLSMSCTECWYHTLSIAWASWWHFNASRFDFGDVNLAFCEFCDMSNALTTGKVALTKGEAKWEKIDNLGPQVEISKCLSQTLLYIWCWIFWRQFQLSIFCRSWDHCRRRNCGYPPPSKWQLKNFMPCILRGSTAWKVCWGKKWEGACLRPLDIDQKTNSRKLHIVCATELPSFGRCQRPKGQLSLPPRFSCFVRKKPYQNPKQLQ